MSELKTCPFCGGVAELVSSKVGFQVYCSDCDGGIMSDDWVKRAAIEVWNNRCESNQPISAKAEIAAYEKAIAWHVNHTNEMHKEITELKDDLQFMCEMYPYHGFTTAQYDKMVLILAKHKGE